MTDDLEGEGFVRSLTRGFSVVRAFRPGQDHLTIAQVAKACSLTRASARRILLTLQNLGYVGVEGRLFHLTAKVLDLGQGFLAQPLWDATRPALQSVADTLNETASAGVLDGFDVVYALRVRSSRFLHIDIHSGARIPAHASSMGRVLLAAMSQPALEGYFLSVELRKYTAATIIDPEALRHTIDTVRDLGWSFVRGEIDEGIAGVSVPLRGRSGSVLAALNVSIGVQRANDRLVKSTIVPLLKDAADKIAANLPSN